jgi:hypothetical protein
MDQRVTFARGSEAYWGLGPYNRLVNITNNRLERQRLSTTKFREPEEIVRWFGAMQAQDYPAAKWAVGQRLVSATDAQIEKAFNDGRILRTHVMRPTWHFVAPDDIGWLLKLTAPRVKAICTPYFNKFGLDRSFLKKTEKVLIKSLRGNNFRTRVELREAMERAGLETGESVRFGYILIHAELEGMICSGPRRGKQFTYALLAERETNAKAMTVDESLAELIRRYFRSHGPATLPDFVWWSGLTRTDANRGIAMVQKDLNKVTIAGRTFWDSGREVSKLPESSARMLPAFDEYLVGYKDRSDALNPKFPPSAPNWNSLLGPHIAMDGKLVGSWNKLLGKDSVGIQVHPYGRLGRVEWRAIEEASERYGQFLAVKASVTRI